MAEADAAAPVEAAAERLAFFKLIVPDADEAARLLRAYELRRNAEDGETFAVDQLSSPGAIAGVCFRDDVEGDAILGDLRTPLAGYKPDAAW